MAFDHMSCVSTFPYQVRGFLLNFGVYHATRAALGLSFQWRLVVKCTILDKWVEINEMNFACLFEYKFKTCDGTICL